MKKIQISNINYTAKGKVILKNISLDVLDGDSLAILGHNGSGKTTLLEIIVGIIKPTRGNVLFDNKSFESIKKDVGVIWDNISIFPWLKAKEVIKYISSMYGIENAPMMLYEQLGIKDFENRLMRQLSQGEKKRVQILIATLADPKVLILDEATSELDPLSRNLIWNNILLSKKRTIIFTTHQWEEAEKYATKIVFINDGEMVCKPTDYRSLLEQSMLKQKIVVHKSVLIPTVSVGSYETDQNRVYLIPQNDMLTINLIKSHTHNFSILPINLEDVYQYLILKHK